MGGCFASVHLRIAACVDGIAECCRDTWNEQQVDFRAAWTQGETESSDDSRACKLRLLEAAIFVHRDETIKPPNAKSDLCLSENNLRPIIRKHYCFVR